MKIQLNCESLKAVYLSERLYKIGLLLAYIRFYSYKIEQQPKVTCKLKVFVCSWKILKPWNEPTNPPRIATCAGSYTGKDPTTL